MFNFYASLVESIVEFLLVAEQVVEAAQSNYQILPHMPTLVLENDMIDIAEGFSLQ